MSQSKRPSPDTSNQDIFHKTSSDPVALLDDATRESKEGDKEKEVFEETINDPLQGEKEYLPKDAREKSLPLPRRSIPEALKGLEKSKEAMREEEEADADYVFKFMDEFICKPLERGFEEIF